MKKLQTAFLTFLLCLGVFGCNRYSDEDQVQVSTDASELSSFGAPARDIVYGPYSIRVTTDSAIIAWEEKTWANDLKHVEVSVAGLSPATRYFYRVNGAEKGGRFVTAPEDNGSFSFFVMGDSQIGADVSQQIAARMIEVDPDASFALHMGDMVGSTNSLENWEKEWWTPLADLMLYLPVYPVMGNHDEDSSWFYRYFGSISDNETNYSFDRGTVHFVFLNLNSSIQEDDENVAWLKNDLEANRDAALTVVCHHHPVYYSTTASLTLPTPFQSILVPIYEEYGVDLVLSGDYHGYQHHLKNNIHYVISAGAGGRLYDYGLPLEGMTLQLYKEYNFCRCLVDDSSLHFTTYDIEGNVLDSADIAKDIPADIGAQIVVETDKPEVVPGEQFVVNIFADSIGSISSVLFSLPASKDDPSVSLAVVDADAATAGVQIEKGDLGGSVVENHFDNATASITYNEIAVPGISGGKRKVAAATFMVPEDAPNTVLYLIPRFMLRDASGSEIFNVMGGTSVVVKKKN